MSWQVDGIPLSTLAFNVQNRSAGWHVPAKRGDNLSIPGRHGALWVPNKPFDQGALTLSMWAVGAEEDGRLPDDDNRSKQCRENLDKLTALFAQAHKLLEVTQVESLAFGAENIQINPRFESVQPTSYPTYENLFLNPAMRNRSTITQVQNLFPNPAFRALQSLTWTDTYENLVPDPRNKYQRTTAAGIMASNYWVPAGYESYAAGATVPGWSTAVNTQAIAATSSGAAEGSMVFRILATNNLSPTVSIGTMGPYYGGAVGFKPQLRFKFRRYQNTSTVRTFQFRLVTVDLTSGDRVGIGDWVLCTLPTNNSTWVDAAYDSSSSLVIGTNQWVRAEFALGADTWLNGEGVLFDMGAASVDAFPGQSPGYWTDKSGPFFSASLGWGGLSQDAGGIHRWSANPDSRWIPSASTDSTSAYYAFTDRPDTDPGGTTLSFIAMGFQNSGIQYFTLPLETPTAGKPYTMSLSWRGRAGTTTSIYLRKKGLSDTNPVIVRTLTIAGAATPTNSGTRMNGAFSTYATDPYVAQAGDELTILIGVPVRADGHPSGQLAQLSVTDSPYTGEALNWADGDTPNRTDTQFAWAGTQYDSKTIFKRRAVLQASGTPIPAAQAATPLVITAAQIICRMDGEGTQMALSPVFLPSTYQGLYFSVGLFGALYRSTVAAPKAQIKIECLSSGMTVLDTFTSEITTPGLLNLSTGTGTMQTLSVIIPPDEIPTTTRYVRGYMTMVDPLRGQSLVAAQIMMLPIGVAPATIGVPNYFDGNIGGGGTWSGTANNSPTNYQINFPVTWTVTAGVPIADATALVGYTNYRPGFGVDFDVSFGYALAGGTDPYLLGLRVSCDVRDEFGNQLEGIPVQAYAYAYDPTDTLTGTISLGRLPGRDGPQEVHGSFVLPTGKTMSRMRFSFATSRPDVSLRIRIDDSYLYATTGTTCPAPRLDFNRVANPDFGAELDGWASQGTAWPIGTALGSGALLSSGAVLVSEALPASAGDIVHVGTWARRTALAAVSPQLWCGRSVRTNLAKNPSFEGPLSGMTTMGCTVSQSSAWAQDRAQSLHLVPDGSTFNSIVWLYGTDTGALSRAGLIKGHTYTISATGRLDSVMTTFGGSWQRRIVVRMLSGGVYTTHAISPQLANAAGTARVSVTFTVPTDCDDIYLGLGCGASSAVDDIYWDALLIEESPILGSYFDGNTAWGTSETFYRWAESPDASVSWCVAFTSIDLPAITQTSYAHVSTTSVVVPANTDFVSVAYRGDGAEIAYSYLGAGVNTHTDPGNYDPRQHPYFDGYSPDFYGQPTGWRSAADGSRSRVLPAFPTGWQSMMSSTGPNLHILPSVVDDLERPPGSLQSLAGFPAAAKNTSRTQRTQGFFCGDNSWVSGEISVSIPAGVSLDVQVYGAVNSSSSGYLLWTTTLSGPYLNRVQWRDVVVSYDWVYVQLVYRESENAAGYRVLVDNLLILPSATLLGTDYPGYFDGSTTGAQWSGTIDGSVSQYFGGGRRAYCEVVEAIDMTSMAGGSRAEFVVDMVIPGSFWEDLLVSSISHTFTAPPLSVGGQLTLTQLLGSTAPIVDTILGLTISGGSLDSLRITDKATGSWLEIAGPLSGDLTINNIDFTVKSGLPVDPGNGIGSSGPSIITKVTRGGSNQLLPVTPVSSTEAPVLVLFATGVTSGVTVDLTVTGRRRYVLA